MDVQFLQFSRIKTHVSIPGKLSEILFNVLMFFNPGEKDVLNYKTQGTNLSPTFIKNKDFLPWIGEQQYIAMYLRQFSRHADIRVTPGKLLELHFYASLLSNPGEKVLIIVAISCSQDLRV